MRTIICLLTGAALLTGCGGATAGDTSSPAPESSPSASAHKPAQGPPDAYLTLNDERAAMAIGTYCWTTVLDDGTGVGQCADSAGWDQVTDIPRLTGQAGDQATLELGFDPSRPVEITVGHHHLRLQPGRTLAFTLPATGIVEVFAYARSGDVSYGLRVAGG